MYSFPLGRAVYARSVTWRFLVTCAFFFFFFVRPKTRTTAAAKPRTAAPSVKPEGSSVWSNSGYGRPQWLFSFAHFAHYTRNFQTSEYNSKISPVNISVSEPNAFCTVQSKSTVFGKSRSTVGSTQLQTELKCSNQWR